MAENKSETVVGVKRDNDAPALLNDIPPRYEPLDQQPYDRDFGLRLATPGPETHGIKDICIVRKGLAVLIGDVEHDYAHSDLSESGDVVKFHFRYSGSSEIGAEGDELEPVDPMTFGVLIQPSGMKKIECFPAHQHEQSVTLLCDPPFLEEIISGTSLLMSTPLGRFLYGEQKDMYYWAVRMRPEMVSAVKSLFETNFTGRLQQLQIEAKTLELLCYTLDQLSKMWSGSGAYESPLRQRDIKRVAEICEILENDLSKAPTINELAKILSWNETQLMRVFRQAVGTTVHNYLHRARMEKACELLVNTEMSITRIAMSVGYEYSSNFTTAFRKHFGVTPKLLRAEGIPTVM